MLQEKKKKKKKCEDMGLCAFMIWQEQRPRGQSECVKTVIYPAVMNTTETRF